MLTDNTYHEKGRYFIPNSNDLSVRPDNVENSKTGVQYFIDIYERELLVNCLGISNYNELATVYPNIEDVGNEKWFNLVNGANYVYNEVNYRFDGLLGFNKNSLISAFIFCKYLQNDESYYSTTGVIKNKSENGSVFDPTQKYIDAWSDFICKYQDDKQYYNEAQYLYDNFGNVIGIDYFNEENEGGFVSLETYLRHHKEEFENYSFKRYETINSFGI